MATHSSLLAWRIPWREEPGGLQSMGFRESDTTEPLNPIPHIRYSVLVTASCPTLCDPGTVARQAPLSMGFSRQEYWSGLPCPSPGRYRYIHKHASKSDNRREEKPTYDPTAQRRFLQSSSGLNHFLNQCPNQVSKLREPCWGLPWQSSG